MAALATISLMVILTTSSAFQSAAPLLRTGAQPGGHISLSSAAKVARPGGGGARGANIVMMAKKKLTAAQKAAMEALDKFETVEAPPGLDPNLAALSAPVVMKKEKKSKKDKKKDAAAEADSSDDDGAAGANIPPPVKMSKEKGKKGLMEDMMDDGSSEASGGDDDMSLAPANDVADAPKADAAPAPPPVKEEEIVAEVRGHDHAGQAAHATSRDCAVVELVTVVASITATLFPPSSHTLSLHPSPALLFPHSMLRPSLPTLHSPLSPSLSLSHSPTLPLSHSPPLPSPSPLPPSSRAIGKKKEARG